jgi:hypothetical protein
LGTAVKPIKPARGRVPSALKKYVSIWADGKVKLIDSVFDPKIVRHHPPSIRPRQIEGIEVYKAYIAEFRNMHPDLQFEVFDAVVTDRGIAYRYEASALNPATNQRFTFGGLAITKFSRAGKIVEEWVTWDTYDLMVQVGIIPPREP